MTIEFLNATGSEYLIPASGSEFRVNPVARVEARVTGVTRPSGSGNIGTFTSLQPSDQSLLVSSYGQRWTDDNTVFLKHQVWVGGANFGPGDLVRSCSLEINDSVVSGSAPVYLRYQPLNGAQITAIDGVPYTGGNLSLAQGTTKFTASLYYWGIDEGYYSRDVVSSLPSVWNLVGEQIVSQSGDEARVDLYFSGTPNTDPGTRNFYILFKTFNSLRAYETGLILNVEQAGESKPSVLYSPSSVDPQTLIYPPQDFVLEKNGEVVLEDTIYPKPGQTGGIYVSLGQFVDPYLETRPLEQFYYPNVFTLKDTQGNILLGPAAYLPVTQAPGTSEGSYDDYYKMSMLFTHKWARGIQMFTVFNGNRDNQDRRIRIQPNVGSSPTKAVNPGMVRHVRTNSVTSCDVTSLTLQFLDDEYLVDRWVWDERVDNCTFQLYWINPDLGGIQQFPFTGRVVPVKTAERYSIINPRLTKYDYKRGIETRYRLNTGLLWEELESDWMMDNIFRSPMVYLALPLSTANGATGIPQSMRVNVDLNSIDLKTFKNQGRVVPEYEFEVVQTLQQITK